MGPETGPSAGDPATGLPDGVAGLRRRRSRSPRQEEQPIADRQSIVLRAVGFFARNGYAKTTLQAVAESIGLTPGSKCRTTFQSKEGLFLEPIQERRLGGGPAGAAGPGPTRTGRDPRTLRLARQSRGGRVDPFRPDVPGRVLHDAGPTHLGQFVSVRSTHIMEYIGSGSPRRRPTASWERSRSRP